MNVAQGGTAEGANAHYLGSTRLLKNVPLTATSGLANFSVIVHECTVKQAQRPNVHVAEREQGQEGDQSDELSEHDQDHPRAGHQSLNPPVEGHINRSPFNLHLKSDAKMMQLHKHNSPEEG